MSFSTLHFPNYWKVPAAEFCREKKEESALQRHLDLETPNLFSLSQDVFHLWLASPNVLIVPCPNVLLIKLFTYHKREGNAEVLIIRSGQETQESPRSKA